MNKAVFPLEKRSLVLCLKPEMHFLHAFAGTKIKNGLLED